MRQKLEQDLATVTLSAFYAVHPDHFRRLKGCLDEAMQLCVDDPEARDIFLDDYGFDIADIRKPGATIDVSWRQFKTFSDLMETRAS
jgi:hypothetical protein